MPHGIPLGDPDRYIEVRFFSDQCRGLDLPQDLVEIFYDAGGIGVHRRPKRNRYTVDNKPISRRMIDRLVYFGVIDEGEL